MSTATALEFMGARSPIAPRSSTRLRTQTTAITIRAILSRPCRGHRYSRPLISITRRHPAHGNRSPVVGSASFANRWSTRRAPRPSCRSSPLRRQEIKIVLGNQLGATLVESSDPLWQRDPDIEQMKVDFRRALARLVPLFMPDLLFRLGTDGQPLFKEFAAAIVPTEFLPGKDFGSGNMQPIDYCVAIG